MMMMDLPCSGLDDVKLSKLAASSSSNEPDLLSDVWDSDLVSSLYPVASVKRELQSI